MKNIDFFFDEWWISYIYCCEEVAKNTEQIEKWSSYNAFSKNKLDGHNKRSVSTAVQSNE